MRRRTVSVGGGVEALCLAILLVVPVTVRGSGRATPVVLVRGQREAASLTAAGQRLYWIEMGTVRLWTAQKNGEGVRLLDQGEPSSVRAFGLAVDSGQAYWLHGASLEQTARLEAVPLASGTARVMAAALGVPGSGLALDRRALYWTGEALVPGDLRRGSFILRQERRGGTPRRLIATAARGYDLHCAGTRLYWRENPASAATRSPGLLGAPSPGDSLMTGSITGGVPRQVAARIQGFAVSRSGKGLSWITDRGEIWRAPAAGGGRRQRLGQLDSGLRVTSLSTDAGHLCWIGCRGSGGAIIQCLSDRGGPIRTVAALDGTADDLVLEGENLYWIADRAAIVTLRRP